MEAQIASWLPHLKSGQWFVLALLAVALLAVAINHYFAKHLWLMAVVLNWRHVTDGDKYRYYAMLAICGDGDYRNRLDSQEIEVSQDDYLLASSTAGCLAVDCCIGFITKAITVRSTALRLWPPAA